MENNKPQVRFDGFDEDWCEDKILNIAPLQRGFDLPKNQMNLGKYPVVMSNGISEYHDEFKIKGPGIVTGRSGTIGNIHYVETDFWPHNTSLWVTDFKGNYPLFIYTMFKRLNLNKFGTGSSVPTLNRNDVHDLKVYIPKLKEQKVISDFFENLDKLITEHQQKHNKLKALKKAMLSKMFPQHGQTVPDIRFKEFSGDWEEKKLDELGEIVTGSTPLTEEQSYYSKSGIPWVTPTDISNNVTYSTQKHLSILGELVARVVPKNTILITCIASIGKNTILGTKGSFNQQINGLIPNEKEHNPYFLFTLSSLWSLNMKRSASSGIMQIVPKSEFSNIITFIPPLQEQKLIGNYFKKIDDLIDNHGIQIEKLQNIKKAFLAKMFI